MGTTQQIYCLQSQQLILLHLEFFISDDTLFVQSEQPLYLVNVVGFTGRIVRRTGFIPFHSVLIVDVFQIFKDPLTTAEVIDRVVHHSTIIDFCKEVTSLRTEEAVRTGFY